MTNLLASEMTPASGARTLTIGTQCSTSVSPGTFLPPTIPRSQAYFWTAEWQRWERQADLDRMVGDYYEPEDVDDLIDWLNADD